MIEQCAGLGEEGASQAKLILVEIRPQHWSFWVS